MRKHLDLVDESITLIIYNYFLAQFTRRCYPFIRLYPLIMQLNNNVRYSINSYAIFFPGACVSASDTADDAVVTCSKRHVLQAVKLSRRVQTAVHIVSKPPVPINGCLI